MKLKDKFKIENELVKEDNLILLTSPNRVDTYRFKVPIAHPCYQGYFLIPGFLEYGMHQNGDVIRFSDGYLLTKYTAKSSKHVTNMTGGYINYQLYGAFTTGRHRLLMLTFSEYEFHPADRWVNHKDGIPGNDNLDNLEWVTPSENIKHAYDNNLHPNKIVGVDIWNWKTGETHQCRTINDACEIMKLGRATVDSRLSRNNGSRFEDGWRIKRLHDEWAPLAPTCGHHASQSFDFKGYSFRHDKWVIFHTAQQASEMSGDKPSTIIAHLARRNQSPTMNGWMYRRLDEDFPVFDEDTTAYIKNLLLEGSEIKSGVKVTDINTGEVTVGSFESISRGLEISVGHLHKVVKSGKPRNGKTFKLIKL